MKIKVLNWAKRFDTFCFLDNHQYCTGPSALECVLAAGVRRQLSARAGTALSQLRQFSAATPGWIFGHFGFGLAAELADLPGKRSEVTGFADLFFFEPEVIVRLSPGRIEVEGGNAEMHLRDLLIAADTLPARTDRKPRIRQRMRRDEYLAAVIALQRHILRGDCYEINYCQEFFSEGFPIDPLLIYAGLMEVSASPFAALYRVRDSWLICGSPERYLMKRENRLISQPIKGTARRLKTDPGADEQLREQLLKSEKERAENVMIVDLVRNDLAQVCEPGSVRVDELFGVYSFPTVHQLISTISGDLKKGVDWIDIVRATFPMGSMTGAPKRRVLELIRQYEVSDRGLYSGALGYRAPGGDFDFNVVIRSILYNAANDYLSFLAGSGITFYSDPAAEWDECLVKAAAMRSVLEGNYR